MSGKVVFVTPRYGTQVVGGAETAARQLAEHLRQHTTWEAEVHTTCAMDPHTWADELEIGDDRGQRGARAPPSLRPRPASRFYDLDGLVHLRPRHATLEEGRRWWSTTAPSRPIHRRRLRIDADVVAFYPYLYHPTVAAIGKVRAPTVLHPAAHDEPALYLPVFRGTFGNADAICYHTVSERKLVERMYPVADRRQIVLGLGIGESEGAGRPGGALTGLGDRPYIVSVGRVDEHKGSKMLAEYFAAFKDRHPGPLALVFVGPVSVKLSRTPTSWSWVRSTRPTSGTSARCPGRRVALGARVVLAGGTRSVDGQPSRPGQRRVRPHPRALRALRWRAVVHLLPRIRGSARPFGH